MVLLKRQGNSKKPTSNLVQEGTKLKEMAGKLDNEDLKQSGRKHKPECVFTD